MPKLTGNLQFTGSMNNMSAYKMRGSDKLILRMKGGPSKEQIKSSPNFVNTRSNNAEFGGCSKAGTSIRRAIIFVKHLGDTTIGGQLNALARIILKLDKVNHWGQRSILFSQNHQLLDGFNLNRQLLFNSIMRHPVSSTIFRNTGTANLVIPGLLPGINFFTPPQYQLCRFIISLGVIPDMVFTEAFGYGPANKDKYQAQKLYTEWFAVKESSEEQSFDIQLDDFTGLADSSSLVLAIGIEFGYAVSNSIIKGIKYAGSAVILATG